MTSTAKAREAEPRFRIGQGSDVHRTEDSGQLILGGYPVTNEFGLIGHSDADVLTHAIIDALLGALNQGDIGSWFPPNDETYRDASSIALLTEVLRTPPFPEWEIANLDATIFAETPKMQPHIPEIRAKLTLAFAINDSRISVKAKTCEGIGPVGRRQAIAAESVVLLQKDGVSK